jgi:hypothetical protein
MFSVCIPRIFNNIPTSKIVKTFESLNLGEVESVDIVMKTGKNNEPIKMAFVHFHQWYNNSGANNLRQKIEDPNCEAKLVYDDPWYWIVLPNTSEHKDNVDINTNINISKKLEELENEVSCIYEELFQREYMPSVKPLWDTNTYGNQNPMSISELDIPLHLPPRHAKIYPESDTFYDVELDLNSESDDDDDDLSEITHYDNSQMTYQDKLWMTQNVCDNA